MRIEIIKVFQSGPEGTAGVVRALIENDLDRHGIDVWYLGPMYRYERPQKEGFVNSNNLEWKV